MTEIEPTAPTTLKEINLAPRGEVRASPPDWRDQILYFLLPVRFTDGVDRPLYNRAQPQEYLAEKARGWQMAETGKEETSKG